MEIKDFVLGYGAGKNSAVSEKIVEEVDTWLDEHITNPDSPPLDRSLTSSSAAAPADLVGDISDTVSDVKNTLNHKADVIYDTASGDIASFPDGADGLPVKDLTVAIEPVQSGTGDPSPTNVRPISGWTGANVTRTGKNLLIPDSIAEIHSTAQNLRNGVEIIKPGTYTVSGKATDNVSVYARTKTADGTYNVYTQIVNGSTINNATYTLAEGDTLIVFDAQTGHTVTQSKADFANAQIQIELGSSASAYEVPVSQVYPITFPSGTTVYGGTLDVTSGVVTVDRVQVDLSAKGSSEWKMRSRSGNAHGVCFDCLNNPLSTGALSEQLYSIGESGYNPYNYLGNKAAAFTDGLIRIGFDDSLQINSVSDLVVFLSNNSVQINYPISTPQTYQLDPVTVTTLLGQNNIWTDCGPSTVEYQADTKLYIQKINAPTDDDMIADANVASGQYFIVNNNLYISTAAILAGDPIKPGTNCTLTNLAEALNAINS